VRTTVKIRTSFCVWLNERRGGEEERQSEGRKKGRKLRKEGEGGGERGGGLFRPTVQERVAGFTEELFHEGQANSLVGPSQPSGFGMTTSPKSPVEKAAAYCACSVV